MNISVSPSSGRPTVLGMSVITESSPPSDGRIRTGETMNTFEAPSGGRTTTPSRAGSPRAGDDVVDAAGRVDGQDLQRRGITVRTEVVPTWVAAGQVSAWNAACVQRGFEVGSPARPGGRLIVMSRTCSVPEP